MKLQWIKGRKPWIYPIFVVFAAVGALIWSWGTWPDPVVDFGRELYVPWRLSEGQVLYRDIVSFNGPFSHYAMALWFLCFGVSLRSLIFFNILFLSLVLILIYNIFYRVSGRGSALLTCLTFIAGFAFSQLHPVGNFSWMSPYSHELTHGVGLSLLSIFILFHFTKKGRSLWIGASGFIMGLVFLTKAEVFLAGSVACVSGLTAIFGFGHQDTKKDVKVFVVWLGFFLIPIAVSYLLFSMALSKPEALQAVMGTWPYVFNPEHRNLWFFKWVMGTLDPVESGCRIIRWVGWYLMIFIPVLGLALSRRQDEKESQKLAIIVFVLFVGVFSIIWLKHNLINWLNIPQPWQIFTGLMVIIFVRQAILSRKNDREFAKSILRLMMAVFSFFLLGKMILNVRIWHYGFALALPAALMVVAALWTWIPKSLEKYGGKTIIFRGAVLAVWLVAISAHIGISEGIINNKNYLVGKGKDVFRSDERGHVFNQAVQFLEKTMKPGETLVTLPEGVMLNYLLRVNVPTPFIQHTPPNMKLFGEKNMLSCLEKSPPDWIVLIHRDDSIYDVQFFGKDYGKSIWQWMAKHYVFKNRFGSLPFQNEYFGILIGKYRGE